MPLFFVENKTQSKKLIGRIFSRIDSKSGIQVFFIETQNPFTTLCEFEEEGEVSCTIDEVFGFTLFAKKDGSQIVLRLFPNQLLSIGRNPGDYVRIIIHSFSCSNAKTERQNLSK